MGKPSSARKRPTRVPAVGDTVRVRYGSDVRKAKVVDVRGQRAHPILRVELLPLSSSTADSFEISSDWLVD